MSFLGEDNRALGTDFRVSTMEQGSDASQASSPGDALYSLRLENQTGDLVYIGDTRKALAEVPDATAFLVPGQTFFSADFSYQTNSKFGVVQAAGAVFYVLRFTSSDAKAAINAASVKDLLVMAQSAVSVIYGGELRYTSGPLQATEQTYTDGPTSVVTDTLDGYMVQAYVTDTTRSRPSTTLIVAMVVLAAVILACLLGTYHIHHELRIEHKALDMVEPPQVAAQLRAPQ